MREHASNIAAVCEPCAKARLAPGQFKGKDPSSFLGQFVKLGFEATNPKTGEPTTEHMWVLVDGLHELGLQGTLNNDPVLICEYRNGDAVAFSVEEIEATYRE